MAENNNLDDLILTEPEGEGGRKKGLLVLLGLVVLLAVIGVVLTNIIMNSGEDENKTTQSIKDEIATNLEMEKEKVQIGSNKSKDDENLDDDLAPLDEQDNLAKSSLEDTKESDKDSIITGASVVTAGTAAATAVKKKIAEKKESIRSSVKKKINDTDEILAEQPKHIEKKRVVKKKEHTRRVHKEVSRVKRDTRVSYGGNVYIQVGSFSKGPSSSFINKIRKVGLRYRIKEVNGFRRVLVGPFRSVNDAQRVLPKVKAYIAPNAFIKR